MNIGQLAVVLKSAFGFADKAYANQVNPVWRGLNQNMRLDVQGFAGGTNIWSRTVRSRHYSKSKFRRVRAVLQTFYPTGTPIVDTNFPNSMNFQVAFEKQYANAITGIAGNRPLFMFNGVPFVKYNAASPPANGYLISDVLDLGEYINADQFFGLWTTTEITARSGTNLLPYTKSASNFIERYQGKIAAANVSQIDANSASNATAVTSFTTTQTGEANYFTPVMLLVEDETGMDFVFVIGDSISFGVGEGNAGSSTYGDSVGSALGNSGIVDRSLYEFKNKNACNIAKGSDGNKYLKTPSNWPKRLELLKLANPTHVINSNSHNDLTPAITISGWAATTAYAKYDCKSASGGIWMCVTEGGGTSGTTSPTGTGQTFFDGGLMWSYVIANPAASTSRGAAEALAQMASVNLQIKTAVPNATIIVMKPTPDASSTDSWATSANQTPATNYGDALSRRGYMRGAMDSNLQVLQASLYFDPSIYLEYDYPNQTSKWVVSGSANLVTNDGTHPNSYGYYLGAQALSNLLF